MTTIPFMNNVQYMFKSANFNQDRIMQAIEFANEQHMGQSRKSIGNPPFIGHCLNVGDILTKVGANEDTVIAGILHDTIEDTAVKKNQIIEKFGNKVYELINFVTEQDKSKSWKERAEDYINVLKKAPASAQCISAADKVDNMNSMSDCLSKKYNIFQNMKATPNEHLNKFDTVFDVVKENIPQELRTMYVKSLKNLKKNIKLMRF